MIKNYNLRILKFILQIDDVANLFTQKKNITNFQSTINYIAFENI
jgi:hypothetical protein